MNPTITISIHGQEETLTLQEAITLRNNIFIYMDKLGAKPPIAYKRTPFTEEEMKICEAELTAAINEHQAPVAAFLNRLPDNHESKK
jgi:hypothetical protein